MITLETPLKNLPRIGPKYVKNLKKLGIATVGDLLFHFPFRYDDYSKILPVSSSSRGDTVTVEGEIIESRTTRTWKRKMFLTEILLKDDSGTIRALWFNQPYLAENLTEGKKIRISGKITGDASGLYFSNPAWELASRAPTNTGRLVPVYPETEGVTSRWLRWQIQFLLKFNFRISDPVPEKILKKLNLPGTDKAINYIHFPDTLDHALVAQKRFAFEEMFLVQLKSLQIRSSWQKEQAVKIKFNEKLIKNFVKKLPFKLTDAQRKSAFEILKDLEKSRPMNRLLNGDVGSGKTVVAAVASLQAINKGYQVAIMAPTEVLARQHFDSFIKLFSSYKINIGLLTNSYKMITCHPELVSGSNNKMLKHLPASLCEALQAGVQHDTRTNLLKKIQSSQINLVIGTHALIQEDIRFKNLALIIVDEQHRFGVTQRAYLQQKSSEINDGLPEKIPHFLTMTATPIPRTLALAFFGNLDISILDEMPAERKKIITGIVNPVERNKTYEFIRAEIKKGRQCFIILPLVEESEILTEVKAAVQEYERLSREIFSDLKLGLIHGRLKADEKEKVMREFAGKKIDILVATPVVEVGIDIPNATAMIIEDADRFGLSQLHQFRGRIGRGKYQSYCFLFTSSNSSNVRARLKALVESEDGFKIAEKDLELRGPGEFFGTRQSGLPDIAMENLANVRLIQIAREEAQELLKSDPPLKNYPYLKKALQKFEQEIHLE
ncbi:MAG: ATP-dependent DNA helicase RecG [Candidatus Moranbacteria bacterium]|nr:ATP-dependent DNA helicase RecG [Candidatus Moranbacteria bacterium]